MTDISINTAVQFHNDHGRQTGTVRNFVKCLTNGRQHALVELAGDPPGRFETVPASELVRVCIAPFVQPRLTMP
jgi:hypothetical protein